MSEVSEKIWFITGANRGLGAAIARAALEAGNFVVAAARNTASLTSVLGEPGPRLLTVALDVTDAQAAEAAVQAIQKRFKRIDVLVNNAGYGQLGAFEEIAPEAIERQFATNVLGLMHITRAVLPMMRQQRSGQIFNMSSVGGYQGGDRYSIYAASKFAVEGFSESLSAELATFGIHVTVVEPGFFRTDFLENNSIKYGGRVIDDYAAVSAERKSFYEQHSGNQAGDPAKLAAALLQIAAAPAPPTRFQVGPDAVDVTLRKNAHVQEELDQWQELSMSTDFSA